MRLLGCGCIVLCLAGKHLIISDERTATAGGNNLVTVETEHAHSAGAANTVGVVICINRYIKVKQDGFDENGDMKPEKLMTLAENKYKILVERGVWTEKTPQEQKILTCWPRIMLNYLKLALTARYARLTLVPARGTPALFFQASLHALLPNLCSASSSLAPSPLSR